MSSNRDGQRDKSRIKSRPRSSDAGDNVSKSRGPASQPHALPIGAGQSSQAKNPGTAAKASSRTKSTVSNEEENDDEDDDLDEEEEEEGDDDNNKDDAPTSAGPFCVIVPDQSASPTNEKRKYDMWGIQLGPPTRSNAAKEKDTTCQKTGSCAAVACSGDIISIGNHDFGRASSTQWENHAEENSLLNSAHAIRDEDYDYVHKSGKQRGKHETVVAVTLQVSCILICLEPCFDKRYSGHGCRDFFTPNGRLFKPPGGKDQKKVLGRFVPPPNQKVVPIFCFALQAKKAGKDKLPATPDVSAYVDRKKYLTDRRREMSRIDPDYHDSLWSRKVRELYRPFYGLFDILEEEWHTMHDFLTKKNWTTMNDMVVPKEADHMPRSHVLGTTANMGHRGSVRYEELLKHYEESQEGSQYAMKQRAELEKNLSEAQDKAEQLQRELQNEMDWTPTSSTQETHDRRSLPDMKDSTEYGSLKKWEKEDPEELHHAAVNALWELSRNAEWIVDRRTEVIIQNEATIVYWQRMEKRGYQKRRDDEGKRAKSKSRRRPAKSDDDMDVDEPRDLQSTDKATPADDSDGGLTRKRRGGRRDSNNIEQRRNERPGRSRKSSRSYRPSSRSKSPPPRRR